jgi:hypothetical protein
MRGSTVKKINDFVDKLIAQTPPEEIDKSREQMITEVKRMWKTGKNPQTFIKKVLKGDFDGNPEN